MLIVFQAGGHNNVKSRYNQAPDIIRHPPFMRYGCRLSVGGLT